MKKQILFLAMFTLALIFAGTNNVFGQCTPSEKNPNAGVEYTYSTTFAGTQPNYDWYVTKNVNVLAGTIALPSPLFSVAAATPYNNATTGVNNIKITWTAAAIADGGPFYLVLRYSEKSVATPDPNCRVENLRVIEIKPINTFLLAFEGAMLSGSNYAPTAGSNVCAAPITAGVVNPVTPDLTLTYGQNTLYYVATASGIIGDWYPRIRIPALVAASGQVYVSAEWSSDMTGGGTWNTFGAAATSLQQDLLSATAATASVAGIPILIKIVINNVNYQTIADQGIQLALDGFLPPPAPADPATSKSDITSTTDCTPLAPFGRTATVTVNKRPNLTTNPAAIIVTN